MSSSFYISSKVANKEDLTLHMMTMVIGLLFNQKLSIIWYEAGEKKGLEPFMPIINKRSTGGVIGQCEESGYTLYSTSFFNGQSFFVLNRGVDLEKLKVGLEAPFLVFVAPSTEELDEKDQSILWSLRQMGADATVQPLMHRDGKFELQRQKVVVPPRIKSSEPSIDSIKFHFKYQGVGVGMPLKSDNITDN